MGRRIAALIVTASLLGSATWAQTVERFVTGISQGGTLNVRSGPGAHYSDIGDLAKAQPVRVEGYDATGQWARIAYQGGSAYVFARYLADKPPAMTGANRVVGIAADDPDGGLVLRSGPGRSFGRLSVVAAGAVVQVARFSSDTRWAQLRDESGPIGWVRASYLQAVIRQAPEAGPFPALFEVSGVASDDVLWLRSAPDASSAPIGNLPPNGRIEVLALAGPNWARVRLGTTTGYANMRYLRRMAGGSSGQNTPSFPDSLTCNGTEPFWSLSIDANRLVTFTTPDGTGPSATISQISATPGQGYPFSFTAAPYSGRLERMACSDGMSDIAYAMRLRLTAPDQYGNSQSLMGCCNAP